jgi:hypothetical protein
MVSSATVATRSSRMSSVFKPFLLRWRTIDLWSMNPGLLNVQFWVDVLHVKAAALKRMAILQGRSEKP